MPTSVPDASRLIALLQEASAEAARLGPAGVAVGRHLDAAAAEAKALAARGGRPEEGLPVEGLTTGNDQ